MAPIEDSFADQVARYLAEGAARHRRCPLCFGRLELVGNDHWDEDQPCVPIDDDVALSAVRRLDAAAALERDEHPPANLDGAAPFGIPPRFGSRFGTSAP